MYVVTFYSSASIFILFYPPALFDTCLNTHSVGCSYADQIHSFHPAIFSPENNPKRHTKNDVVILSPCSQNPKSEMMSSPKVRVTNIGTSDPWPSGYGDPSFYTSLEIQGRRSPEDFNSERRRPGYHIPSFST